MSVRCEQPTLVRHLARWETFVHSCEQDIADVVAPHGDPAPVQARGDAGRQSALPQSRAKRVRCCATAAEHKRCEDGSSPGARCAARARARARARTRWGTATSPSPSPTAQAYSSAPTVRAFPSPDTCPPVHPATTPTSCTDPHARAALYRCLPPMLTGARTSLGTMAGCALLLVGRGRHPPCPRPRRRRPNRLRRGTYFSVNRQLTSFGALTVTACLVWDTNSN